MTSYQAGRFYPPNPNSRVWRTGGFIDGLTPGGTEPSPSPLIGIDDVAGLEAALAAKSADGHTHTASELISGDAANTMSPGTDDKLFTPAPQFASTQW